ncbi:hypothetical protein JAAARDRAFT_188447 [Jaapia argillacea MUCL 33604]|uniref:Uncharacterized protein n=1 Tax=Jaapia argillacea MUCL 33604 TaxID=933084 RepID=A0A067QDQ9_9AGAM|nr:hypothetical protein JAAARDRAFT_188447 [Jaapia argillacea MUCL 33604]
MPNPPNTQPPPSPPILTTRSLSEPALHALTHTFTLTLALANLMPMPTPSSPSLLPFLDVRRWLHGRSHLSTFTIVNVCIPEISPGKLHALALTCTPTFTLALNNANANTIIALTCTLTLANTIITHPFSNFCVGNLKVWDFRELTPRSLPTKTDSLRVHPPPPLANPIPRSSKINASAVNIYLYSITPPSS